ncbi:hypothetical protein Nmel_008415 [Mimus melanotis]
MSRKNLKRNHLLGEGSGVKGDTLMISALPGARASCSGEAGGKHSYIKTPTSGAKAAVTTGRNPPLCYQICLRNQDTHGFCKQQNRYKKLSHQLGTNPNFCLVQTEPESYYCLK